MRHPDRTLTWRMITRATVIWVALRVASMVPSIPAALRVAPMAPSDVLTVSLYLTVLIIAVTVALVTLDGRRRNEHLFMANLGVSLPTLITVAAIPPTVLEIALSIGVLLW